MNQLTDEQMDYVCDFINDMIADTNIQAFPGEGAIAWEQIFPQGRYRLTQKQAYKRLRQAGYNPMRLVEFAIQKGCSS